MGDVGQDNVRVRDPWPVVCKGCGKTFMFDPRNVKYYECCSTECVWEYVENS